jgi:RNase P subunit RPR2
VPIQREFEEDQLRWEERIRALSTQRTARMAPPARPQCPPTRLALTKRVGHRDLLLLPRALPALTGDSPESLVCGKCSSLIGSGISCRSARRKHPEGSRLVIRCTCGAMNLVSSGSGRGR